MAKLFAVTVAATAFKAGVTGETLHIVLFTVEILRKDGAATKKPWRRQLATAGSASGFFDGVKQIVVI